jgi:hypothetical protein
MGNIAMYEGRMDKAASLFQEGYETSISQGDRAGVASALGNLGMVARRQGRLDDAFTHFTESITQCREVGDPPRRRLRS